MIPDQDPPEPEGVPEDVRSVLWEILQSRAEGALTPSIFHQKLECIFRDELQPRRLHLLVRELPDGRTRLLIKAHPHGAVRDLIESTA